MTKHTQLDRRRHGLLLVPLTVLPGAIVWAAFWLAFDLLFRLLGAEEIWIPQIVIIVAIIGLGFLVSKPIAKLTSRALADSPAMGQGVAIIAMLVSVVVGESLYLVASVWRYHPDAPVGGIIRAIPEMISQYPGGYIFLKGLFAVCLTVFVKEDVKERIQKMENANNELSPSNEPATGGSI